MPAEAATIENSQFMALLKVCLTSFLLPLVVSLTYNLRAGPACSPPDTFISPFISPEVREALEFVLLYFTPFLAH